MEGRNPDTLVSDHLVNTLAHLSRSLIREGDRHDIVRVYPLFLDQIRRAVCQHPRLSTARAGKY